MSSVKPFRPPTHVLIRLWLSDDCRHLIFLSCILALQYGNIPTLYCMHMWTRWLYTNVRSFIRYCIEDTLALANLVINQIMLEAYWVGKQLWTLCLISRRLYNIYVCVGVFNCCCETFVPSSVLEMSVWPPPPHLSVCCSVGVSQVPS